MAEGRERRRRCWSTSAARPISAGSRGSAPPRPTATARPSRSICARPTRSRRTPRACRADDRTSSPVCSRAASRCCRKPAARRRRDRQAARRLVPSRLERRRDRTHADRPRRACAPGDAGPHAGGFILSRLVAGEAEILSVAVAAARRGKGLARRLLDLHLRRLAGLGARTVFLEVDEGNEPARRLYRRAGFREVGRREGYYRDAAKGKHRRAGAAARPALSPSRPRSVI